MLKTTLPNERPSLNEWVKEVNFSASYDKNQNEMMSYNIFQQKTKRNRIILEKTNSLKTFFYNIFKH